MQQGEVSIAQLEELRSRLASALAPQFEVPEANLSLDLGSRKASNIRMFRHLAQMGAMQVMAFKRLNEMKLYYLVDFYQLAAERKNPLAIFNAARAIHEFHAFLNDVSHELIALRNGPVTEWLQRGQDFYDSIVRARWGTKRKDLIEVARMQGKVAKDVEPKGASGLIRKLAERQGFEHVKEHYGMLCDYVHPNSSSQNILAGEFRTSPTSSAMGKSLVITKTAGPVVRLDFPAERAVSSSLRMTLGPALQAAEDCIDLLAVIPEICFREEECLATTGTLFGIPTSGEEVANLKNLEAEEQALRQQKRQTYCSCGSRKIGRKCCFR